MVLLLLTAVAGTVAALAVPAGLPYDEPAHWSNVLFYAQHLRLPVFGEPGVQYEAQQTPAYYAVAAAIVRLAGQRETAFLAVRLFGVVGLVVMTALIAAILQRVIGTRPVVVVTGTAFVALNPMLIVMSASVQNDTWALVAGFGAVLVAMADRGRHAWWRGIAIGVLGALAILVKVSLVPLVVAVVIVLLCRRRFAEAVASTAVVLVACGWWVVRNVLLYGDLTGQAGVEATGTHFGRGGLSPVVLVREALTYLTLPTEYLRNTISAPAWVDVLAVVVGAVLVVGCVVLATRGRRSVAPAAFWMIFFVGAASVAAWLVQVAFGWEVAFRTAYGVLPLAALAFGISVLIARPARWQWILCAILLAVLAALLVWTGIGLSAAHEAPLLHP
jgi:D-alanyl-D-alanine carboxypeptidase (penicillin-binding protein 5/6)